MLRWKSDPPLQLWIGASNWGLKTGGQLLASGGMPATSAMELPTAINAIALPDGLQGRLLQVVLDDRWCRSFVVRAPSNVQTSGDLDLCIQARMAALFGDSGSAWTVLADRRATGRFAACALPNSVHDALFKLASAAGVSLVLLTPLWAHVCQRRGRASSPYWLAIQADVTTSLVRVEPHGVGHVRTLVSPERMDPEALQRWLRLERGRADPAEEGVIENLRTVRFGPLLDESPQTATDSASRPVNGIDAIDFASRRGLWRWPGWRVAWPLSALSVVFAAASALSWMDWAGSAQAEAMLRSELARSAASVSPPIAPLSPPGSVHTAATAMPSPVVAAVVQRLNMPWPQVFDAFEEAAGFDVALLNLAVDTPQATVRATALARDETAMFAYVRQLNSGVALVHARVARHSTEEAMPGQPVQFTVEAVVRPQSHAEVVPQ